MLPLPFSNPQSFFDEAQDYSPWRFVSMLFAFTFAIAATNKTDAAVIHGRCGSHTYSRRGPWRRCGWRKKQEVSPKRVGCRSYSMSSVLALPALIANEVDVIQISAVPLINASLRGFDVVFIAGMLNTMIWGSSTRGPRSRARSN